MTYGKIVRVSTFGESHGKAIGGILEGIPSNIPIVHHQIQYALDRRKTGQSSIVSPRKEEATVEILSGIMDKKTLGTPIGFVLYNKDARSSAYENIRNIYRPSHADYTYQAKYGIRDWRGGGRASARETACRVVAGNIAQQTLSFVHNIEVRAWVEQVGSIKMKHPERFPSLEEVEQTIVRCPELQTAEEMIAYIKRIQKQKDSVGGVIRVECRNVPAGLGEPVFDKLEAELAKAMLSIPAAKGFEIGSGFSGVHMLGSEHNDPFTVENGSISTMTNFSGGIQGGISNGMPIYFRVAFKPVATIFLPQQTVTMENEATTLKPTGRHDPCVVPRAIPIVEAMTSLVLCDMLMRQKMQNPAIF